eukprot:1332725-Ditylum_brightwellii.AAC.1
MTGHFGLCDMDWVMFDPDLVIPVTMTWIGETTQSEIGWFQMFIFFKEAQRWLVPNLMWLLNFA